MINTWELIQSKRLLLEVDEPDDEEDLSHKSVDEC